MKKIILPSAIALLLAIAGCSGSGSESSSPSTASVANGKVTVDCPTSDGWKCSDTLIGWEGGRSAIVVTGTGVFSTVEEYYEAQKKNIPGTVVDEQEVDGAKIFITELNTGDVMFSYFKEVNGAPYECSAAIEPSAPESLKQDISGVCSSMR